MSVSHVSGGLPNERGLSGLWICQSSPSICYPLLSQWQCRPKGPLIHVPLPQHVQTLMMVFHMCGGLPDEIGLRALSRSSQSIDLLSAVVSVAVSTKRSAHSCSFTPACPDIDGVSHMWRSSRWMRSLRTLNVSLVHQFAVSCCLSGSVNQKIHLFISLCDSMSRHEYVCNLPCSGIQ